MNIIKQLHYAIHLLPRVVTTIFFQALCCTSSFEFLQRKMRRAIGSSGGKSSLLEICHGGTPSSQAMAAGVLRNLAQFEEIKENFAEENVISVLIALSSSGTTLARENSIRCLSNSVYNDETLKMLVAREGGVESSNNYWDSIPIGRGLKPAVDFLQNLASYRPIG